MCSSVLDLSGCSSVLDRSGCSSVLDRSGRYMARPVMYIHGPARTLLPLLHAHCNIHDLAVRPVMTVLGFRLEQSYTEIC